MTAATAAAATVVVRLLTSAPMTSRRRVSRTSGIRANGIPKDSTTWEITSARVGSDAGRDDHERRRQRHEPAHDQRDPPPQEPLHHDLAGEGADPRGGEPGREQRQREQQRGGRPEDCCQTRVRFLDRVNGRRPRRQHLGGNHQHRRG